MQQKPQSDGKSQKKPGQPNDPHVGNDMQHDQGKAPNRQQAGQFSPDGNKQQQGAGPLGREGDPNCDPRQSGGQADKRTDK